MAHVCIADDFEDLAPELTPEEVLATLDADISLSWDFLRHCADINLAAREEMRDRSVDSRGRTVDFYLSSRHSRISVSG